MVMWAAVGWLVSSVIIALRPASRPNRRRIPQAVRLPPAGRWRGQGQAWTGGHVGVRREKPLNAVCVSLCAAVLCAVRCAVRCARPAPMYNVRTADRRDWCAPRRCACILHVLACTPFDFGSIQVSTIGIRAVLGKLSGPCGSLDAHSWREIYLQADGPSRAARGIQGQPAASAARAACAAAAWPHAAGSLHTTPSLAPAERRKGKGERRGRAEERRQRRSDAERGGPGRGTERVINERTNRGWSAFFNGDDDRRGNAPLPSPSRPVRGDS